MIAFLLSPEADEDVWNIWRYLAEETSVSVANRVEAELFRVFEMRRRRQVSVIAAPI